MISVNHPRITVKPYDELDKIVKGSYYTPSQDNKKPFVHLHYHDDKPNNIAMKLLISDLTHEFMHHLLTTIISEGISAQYDNIATQIKCYLDNELIPITIRYFPNLISTLEGKPINTIQLP